MGAKKKSRIGSTSIGQQANVSPMAKPNSKTTHTPRFQTFGVLAGAYVDKSLKKLLTHVCEVDDEGPIRVLCAGVNFDNICPDGYTDEQLAAPATCKTCARRDTRLHVTAVSGLPITEGLAIPQPDYASATVDQLADMARYGKTADIRNSAIMQLVIRANSAENA